MIKENNFAAIDTDIINAIDSTLNDLRTTNQSDYVLFLADAEYKKEYGGEKSKLNPYVINNMTDIYKDSSRLSFLSDFLTAFYSFSASQSKTDDHEQRLHMELMVYTHIWEAKPFLKKLYRLAHLNNEEQYIWKVNIPDNSKHTFIRDDIRKTFEDNNNPLFQIIKYGFHTSLRNAFAHSEYYFDPIKSNRRIILDNYKGNNSWELKEISFNDWSKRFVYSALLSFHLYSLSHKHRINLIRDIGTDTFQIKHPSETRGYKMTWIKYDKARDGFNFIK